MAPTGQQYDSKSGQWLGSTLDSSGEDGTILVRYQIPLSTIFVGYQIHLSTILVGYQIPLNTILSRFYVEILTIADH